MSDSKPHPDEENVTKLINIIPRRAKRDPLYWARHQGRLHAKRRIEREERLAAMSPEERERYTVITREPTNEEIAERTRQETFERLGCMKIPTLVAALIADGDARTDTRARDALTAAKVDDLRFVVLCGGVGCGKTVAAAMALADRGAGRFVTAFGLTRLSPYDEGEMDELETTPLLVLDDLGSEYQDAKGFLRAFLDGLVNARYDAGLRTIATTNLKAAEFADRYGARIADRIKQTGCFVELQGKSMRAAPAKEQDDG